MGYTQDTLKGVSYGSALRVITRVIAVVKIAILARLLSPAEFGIYGIAAIVLGFFETVSQSGTSVLLVQEKIKFKKYLNSAFTISIVRGVLLFFVIFLSAPYLALFFRSSDSVLLIKIISFVALIRGFINPMRVEFLKTLNFAKEFWFSFVVFMVDTLFSVYLTYVLKSPIGIIYGLVAGALTEMSLSYIMINNIPKIELNFKVLKMILHRGKWVTLSSIFSNFFDQGPDVFVGRLLTPATLGTYQAAYKISTMPLVEIGRVVNQVTFPIYVQFATDKQRLLMAFTKVAFAVFILAMLLSSVLFIFSREITLILLGEKWIGVVPILKSLVVFGLLRAMTVLVNPLFNATKNQKYVSAISFISFAVFLVSIVPLVNNFQILGAGYSLIIASIVTLPIIYYYLRRVFKSND